MPDAKDKFASLLNLLDKTDFLALAVSGGSDSVALMLLAAQWAERGAERGAERNGRFDGLCVLTVDHALRKNSAAEAKQVGQWAKALGLKHQILTWQHDGQSSGIQQNARVARYQLMGDWCRQNGCSGVVTAHNSDDQAETMLMRLARGSGVDGLGGMASQTEIFGATIYRPLLDISRTTLQGVLEKAGHDWLEDPSNEDQKFERVRVRAAMPAIHNSGIKNHALNLSANRLRRARSALDHFTDNFMANAVTVFHTGHCEVDRAALEQQPDEIVLRVLSRLVNWAGGGEKTVRLAKVERLFDVMYKDKTDKHTLGGAQIAIRKYCLVIGREFGRISPDLQKSVDVWDNRFRFSQPQDIQPYGLFIDQDKRYRSENLPYFVACSLPVICGKSDTIVVPHIDGIGDPAVNLIAKPQGIRGAVGVLDVSRNAKG